jgi:glycosyltransferase involved in cell wall biosynthesis
MKIAFIIQRYGPGIVGGSETLCRQVAEHLSPDHQIEILTTCAKNYGTWRNEYPEGTDIVNGLVVHRFRVEKERNPITFGLFSQLIFRLPHRFRDEEQWIIDQGPFTPSLIQFIKDHKDEYDLFVFFSYRYYPCIFGLPLVIEKSILIPTAEHEPTLDLAIIQQFFAVTRTVVFLTDEEKDLVCSRINMEGKTYDIIGKGVEVPPTADGTKFTKKFNITSDFLVYVGRVDRNKNCNQLFEYFLTYKSEFPSGVKLVIIGESEMKIPKDPDILFLGFLSEWDKFDGIAASTLLVMPSEFESFSIAVTEAMALGKPVLVNGHCAVLKGHCLNSEGGFSYSTYQEFATYLNRLLSDRDLQRQMGVRGKTYIRSHYTWDQVRRKYLTLIDTFQKKQFNGFCGQNLYNTGKKD